MVLRNINKKLVIINQALTSLHGRLVFDVFGLYFKEIIDDLDQMVVNKIVTGNMGVIDFDDTMILPNFSLRGTGRLDLTWDYFIYIYASHKSQNMKRKYPNNLIDILFLRGFDSQFTAQEDQFCMTGYTVIDTFFQSTLLNKFSKNFNIIKILSEPDLRWIMNGVGSHYSRNGYSLFSTANYANSANTGFYLNNKNWKDKILSLMDSSSLYFVHISNNSESLLFELKSLIDKKLQKHTIIFLDQGWKNQRKTVLKSQKKLKKYTKGSKFIVEDYQLRLNNEKKIKLLLNQFPYQFQYDIKDENDLYNTLLPLINDIKRNVKSEKLEIPFDFYINLNLAQKKEINELQKYVSKIISRLLKDPSNLNLAPLKSFLEMDVFLNLIFGRIKMAAISMVKYSVLSDFSLKLARKKKLKPSRQMIRAFKNHSHNSKIIAKESLSMGYWNQYKYNPKLIQKTIRTTRLITKKYLEQKIRKDQNYLIYEPKNIKKENEVDFDKYIKMKYQMISGIVKDRNKKMKK